MDDQVTYLSKRIEAYKKQNFQHLDNKALVDNLSWNSSRFWADILFDSKQGKNFDFVDFKINFETIHNIKIDIDELKNKFWLRSILSLPAIPKLVSNALYSLEKYITAKAEFEFVGHLNNSENNRFSIKEIEELITNYNSTTFSSIQFGNLKKTFLLVEDKTYKDKEQYICTPSMESDRIEEDGTVESTPRLMNRLLVS